MKIYEILVGGARNVHSFMIRFEVTAPNESVAWEMVQNYSQYNQLGELAQLQITCLRAAPEGSGPRVKQLMGSGSSGF